MCMYARVAKYQIIEGHIEYSLHVLKQQKSVKLVLGKHARTVNRSVWILPKIYCLS